MQKSDRTVRHSSWVIPFHRGTERVLIAKRSKKVNNPGLWNLFGGNVERGSNPIKTARTEFFEEAGIKLPKGVLRHIGTSKTASANSVFHMHFFAFDANHQFHPVMNEENSKYKWVVLSDLDRYIHGAIAHRSLVNFARMSQDIFASQAEKQLKAVQPKEKKKNKDKKQKGSEKKKKEKPEKEESSTVPVFYSAVRQRGGVEYIEMVVNDQLVASAQIIIPAARLVNFVTRPEHRGKGYAKKLLEYAKERGAKCLIARPAGGVMKPETLVKFYEKAGFVKLGPVSDQGTKMAIPGFTPFF